MRTYSWTGLLCLFVCHSSLATICYTVTGVHKKDHNNALKKDARYVTEGTGSFQGLACHEFECYLKKTCDDSIEAEVEKKPSTDALILIQAAHGGSDGTAVFDGGNEKVDVVFPFVRKLASKRNVLWPIFSCYSGNWLKNKLYIDMLDPNSRSIENLCMITSSGFDQVSFGGQIAAMNTNALEDVFALIENRQGNFSVRRGLISAAPWSTYGLDCYIASKSWPGVTCDIAKAVSMAQSILKEAQSTNPTIGKKYIRDSIVGERGFLRVPLDSRSYAIYSDLVSLLGYLANDASKILDDDYDHTKEAWENLVQKVVHNKNPPAFIQGIPTKSKLAPFLAQCSTLFQNQFDESFFNIQDLTKLNFEFRTKVRAIDESIRNWLNSNSIKGSSLMPISACIGDPGNNFYKKLVLNIENYLLQLTWYELKLTMLEGKSMDRNLTAPSATMLQTLKSIPNLENVHDVFLSDNLYRIQLLISEIFGPFSLDRANQTYLDSILSLEPMNSHSSSPYALFMWQINTLRKFEDAELDPLDLKRKRACMNFPLPVDPKLIKPGKLSYRLVADRDYDRFKTIESITVYDLSGKTKLVTIDDTLFDQDTIMIEGLPPGAYIVNIKYSYSNESKAIKIAVIP